MTRSPAAAPDPPATAVSLGAHCYAAWLLRRMGLRRAAMPFDWLFSDPGMVADALDDDFAALLDPAKLTVTRQGDIPHHGHATYSAAYRRPVIFQHHDPSTPEGHAYLQRGVGRLRALLDADSSKLFLIVARAERATPAALERLDRALAARTRRFVLLTVALGGVDSAAEAPRLTPRNTSGGSCCYDMIATSEMHNGLSFHREADNAAIAEAVTRHGGIG